MFRRRTSNRQTLSVHSVVETATVREKELSTFVSSRYAWCLESLSNPLQFLFGTGLRTDKS